MKRISILSLMTMTGVMLVWSGFIGLASAEGAQQDLSQLWQKAASYMKDHRWVPGKLVEHKRTFNLRGQLEEDKRRVFGFAPDNRHGIRMDLQTAEENGQDVSWRVRSTLADSITLGELIGDSPFTPADGQEVRSHFNGQRRHIKGRDCLGFDFIYLTDEATLEGTAWLDRQSGLPVELHSRVVSVPFRRDEIKITAYTESEYYTITDQGDCLLERSKAQMDVAVPKLWFKGQIKTLSINEHHWRYIAAQ